MSNNKLRVALVSTANVSLGSPTAMGYGGAPRYTYWYAPLLQAAGFDVEVLAPKGSIVLGGCRITEAQFPGTHDAAIKLEGSKVLRRARAYEVFVGERLDKMDPDIVKLVSPSIYRLERLPERLLRRTIVAMHMPFSSSDPRIAEWLHRHPEVTVTAMSELHKSDLGSLSGRAQVIRVGIPGNAYNPIYSPLHLASKSLKKLLPDEVLDGTPIVSHVDRFGSNKAQILSLRMYEQSEVAKQGAHLILAGSHLTGPQQVGSKVGEAVLESYSTALLREVEASPYVAQIHVLPELVGHQVEELYRASDVVLAPYGMSHANALGQKATELDSDIPWLEPLGFSPLIAQACGARVVLSDRVSKTSVSNQNTGIQISTLSDGVAAINLLMHRRRIHERRSVHNWVLATHDYRQTAIEYAELMGHLVQRLDGTSFQTDHDAVDVAAQTLQRLERREAWTLATGARTSPVLSVAHRTGMNRSDDNGSQSGLL